jgi:hypothetical protein
MLNNTTGRANAAFGGNDDGVTAAALYSNTTGSYNTALGISALWSNTTASNNTAVGYQAGAAITTAAGVVAIGHTSATTLTTGNYGTYIGYQATANSSSASSEIVICAGGAATGKGSNTAFITANSGSTYNGANTTTWATTSDSRIKKNIVDNNEGLDVIKQIRVRNFEYRKPEEITELPEFAAISRDGVQLGVIAQEIQQVLPECVKQESTGVLSVSTDPLVWHLINAVKELSAQVEQLKAKLGE